MTDKELITLAAKAAGIEIGWDSQGAFLYEPEICALSDAWNPLTDDGDALRLAVKLGMRLNLPTQTYAYVGANDQLEYCKNEDYYAATRRAIVRAAAQIGRTYDRQSA